MTRTQIKATMLLLCIFTLGACQKEGGKKASRLRVNAQTRLSIKKDEPAQKQEGESIRLVDTSIDEVLVCKIATPKDCPAIYMALTEDGSFERSTKDETGAEIEPLDLSLQNQFVVERIEAKSNFSYTFNNPAKERRSKKLVIISASLNENERINTLVDFINYRNVRKEKLLLSKVKNSKEVTESLSIKSDEEVLLVTDADKANEAKQAKTLLKQAGVSDDRLVHQTVSAKNFGYQLENKVLKIIGAQVYLHFILPQSAKEINGTPELLINSTTVSKEDYDLVETNERATLRILNIELFKKISDTVTIKYSIKAN